MSEQHVCSSLHKTIGELLIELRRYHLGLKPGQSILDTIGGAHKLQGWKHNILTDSGGLVFPSCRCDTSDASF